MHDQSDAQLLRLYAEHGNEAAFREIVERHTGLVYGSALRQVASPDLAQDVAQSVFTDLARKAKSLKRTLDEHASLLGWLYRSTRFAALTQLRNDHRRQARERQVVEHFDIASETAPEWDRLHPIFDEAMSELSEEDREALLLRYFKNTDFRTIGQFFKISDDTAQKRVSRALDRLRQHLTNRGVTTTAVALSTALSANAATVTPAGLSATLSSAALAGATITTATAIAMTTLQKTIVIVALAAAVGTGIYEAHQASTLRHQNQLLQERQSPLADQIQQLTRERDAATNRLASLTSEITNLRTNFAELPKLRGEVTKLRNEAQQAPSTRASLLKQKLETMPDKKIPELQFVTEKDWIDASWDADLNTEDGVREALSKLREAALNRFLNEMMKNAIKKYLAAHDGILPADLTQLKPYFQEPVTDEMLQRYKLLQSGKPNDSEELVRLAAPPADDEYDSNHSISINGAWGGRFNRFEDTINTAAREFALNNNGQLPGDPSQITPYLKRPVDPVTIQKYLDKMAADPLPPEIVTLTPALKAYSEANNGHVPDNPSDLAPYLTSPEQQSALQKILRQIKKPAAK
jgi:RNA polymerase sigma factor (sigma-70 family)